MSKFIDELAAFVKSQPWNVIRISQIKDDAEPETVDFQNANPCQNLYSVAKTYTMTAIGLLYDRGLVSLDEKLCDILRTYVPEGIDPRWEKCTVRMALTHRLGLPGGHLDIDVNPALAFGDDFLDYAFKTELIFEPGTEERYSDGAFYLLSRVVYEKTGLKTDDFLWRELFYKMEYREFAWSHCPLGHPMGGTGLYAHSADVAKLGKLYLDGGVWKGERLLSREWCEMAADNFFTLEWDSTHSYYFKGGMNGQKLIVYPSQRRVVAVSSYGADTGAIAEWVRINGN